MTAFPVLWVGPAGSGKLTAARAALGAVGTPTLRTLEIGEYSARYWEAPTHMEIDILDLSMMDKQILPEMLTQLLSTCDVMSVSGKNIRKTMIIRRIHALSPAAATRLRACMEELVWAPGAPAMIWCTARVVNAVVGTLVDGFVYRRVPATVGLKDNRETLIKKVAVSTPVPTISTYVADMLRQLVLAGPPTLEAVKWIRARVYELLGLMITGADLTSNLVWSTVRLATTGAITDAQATRVIDVLSRVRWVPSYRTPLMIETIIASVYVGLYEPKP
jgi:hypothetical protein